MRAQEVNFHRPDAHPDDIEQVFGPFEPADGPFLIIGERETMAHLMHRAGIFSSVGEAKRNGFDHAIPLGWYDERHGKRRVRICIWNPSQPYAD